MALLVGWWGWAMYFATNVKINTWAVRLACFDIGAGAVDLVMATFTFTFTSAQLLQLPRPARFAVGSILSLQAQSDSLSSLLSIRRRIHIHVQNHARIQASYYCQVHVRIHISNSFSLSCSDSYSN